MKLSIKSQKGFSLTELLLALLLVSMISVLLTQLLGFNISSANAFSRYNNQQFTINSACVRLSKDIERAIAVAAEDCITGNEYKTINLSFDSDQCSWKLEGGSLHLDDNKVIGGLADGSKFIYTNECLTVVLIPDTTGTGKYNINVSKPIISQYGLTYKK